MMPKEQPGPGIKDPALYERLRDEGNSKEKSARIANAAAKSSRQAVCCRGGSSGAYEDWTLDELRQRAGQIGISGRSTLSKDELITALRNR